MTKKQVAEAVLAGRRLLVVELRKVEPGTFAANAAKGSPEKPYLNYVCISGDDTCEFKVMGARGATVALQPLKFTKGQLGVVEFSDFARGKYGLGGFAESVELLID